MNDFSLASNTDNDDLKWTQTLVPLKQTLGRYNSGSLTVAGFL